MRDAGAAGAECAVDDDCRLFSDCCSCAGVPKTAGVSTCPALCKQSKCEELGLAGGKASCVAGRCVAGFECDGTKVTCDMGPPKCQGGQVPLVSGGCYQGSCVPAVECASVSNCAVCAGRTTCAVFVQRSGSLRHCVDVPPACGGDSTCTCTGKSVCTGIFSRCTNFSGVRGFVCGCPTC
ncbi:MAG TPA: hypothetical protein VJT73_06620 [Polyangiaceae bacterium]|nr:hypothetical protein [Polyangiaceae bacterium]